MPNGKAKKARRSSKGGGSRWRVPVAGSLHRWVVERVLHPATLGRVTVPARRSPLPLYPPYSPPHLPPSRGGVDVKRESRQRGASEAGAPAARLRGIGPPLASAAGGHTLARATIAQRPWVDKCGRRTRPIRRVVCFLWHLAATHICLFSPSTLVEFLCGRRRAVLHFD